MLLSHYPDVIRKQNTTNVDLVPSGHTMVANDTDVFVINGTGYLTVMPRVFARPQVILVTLEHI